MHGSATWSRRLGIDGRDGDRLGHALDARDWARAATVLRGALVLCAPPKSPGGAGLRRETRLRELRARLLLLRWTVRAGQWEECAHESVRVYGLLLVSDLGSDALLAWLGTVHAVAQLERGWGRRFRASIASVLRHCRTRDAGAAGMYARRLAAAYRRAARERDTPWVGVPFRGVDERRGEGRRGYPCRGWGRLLASSSIGALLDRERIGTNGHAGLRPPEGGTDLVRAWLTRLSSGAFDLEGPGGQVAEASLLGLSCAVRRCRHELTEGERGRVEMVLETSGMRSASAWVRAACLESAAELLLLGADRSCFRGASLVRRARADLALAAGTYFRLGLTARAESAEERSLLLGWGGGDVEGANGDHGEDEASHPPRVPKLMRAAARSVTGESGTDWNPAVVRARCSSLGEVRRQASGRGFVTQDPRTLEEIARLLLLAPSPLPILIHGESGTGKEVLARAVHEWSGLSGDFIAIHCGAIPKDLLESELFGHTRGAFTGAAGEKPGLVELAHKGTLFLDEIGEMSHDAQMKMLRVLENGEVRRVGDVRTRRVDVRVVAATHRNLEDAVRRETFRLDLLHRISSVVVEIPALRERAGDIPLLVRNVLAAVARGFRLDDPALALLLGHSWPGNVRELRSTLLRAAYLAQAVGRTVIGPDLLGIRSLVPITSLFSVPGTSGRAPAVTPEEAQRTRLGAAPSTRTTYWLPRAPSYPPWKMQDSKVFSMLWNVASFSAHSTSPIGTRPMRRETSEGSPGPR
ncbi:MAG: sigma 54-interacting transcriptional regulator [Candidatus Eisenbacteria bacterium]